MIIWTSANPNPLDDERGRLLLLPRATLDQERDLLRAEEMRRHREDVKRLFRFAVGVSIFMICATSFALGFALRLAWPYLPKFHLPHMPWLPAAFTVIGMLSGMRRRERR